ncbi:hypothetical protein LTR05_000667 [Lithohypha guttulata]|uniref:Velvet domain-containing protein n=1 Tax=Lithohypha guttulata TaxID=1690604 RepID=A0AAN7Y9T4_9EURO|nr:hypothetical protein LTR05_000667 [Lithohypha guttulata]
MSQYSENPPHYQQPAQTPLNTTSQLNYQGAPQAPGYTPNQGPPPVSHHYPQYQPPIQHQNPDTQQYPYTPPSPSQSEGAEEEEIIRRSLPDPPAEVRTQHGRTYALDVVQQPLRARMCGFGDKDRRPISTAPIVRAVIRDAQTGEEIDYKNAGLEVSQYVCFAWIYDIHARDERCSVKTAPGQAIISTSMTCGYPTTVMSQSPARVAPRVLENDPAHQIRPPYAGHNALPSGHYMQNGQSPFVHGTRPNSGMFPPILNPPPQIAGIQYGFQPAPTPYGVASTQAPLPPPNVRMPPGPAPPPTPPPNRHEDLGQRYSQNLIGNFVQTGQLLEDLDGKTGIFFIFSDLSVRNEEWFRLKFGLLNVGLKTDDMSHEEVFRLAEQHNTAPSAGPNLEAAKNGTRRLEGLTAGLLEQKPPYLATRFSQAFKVYSAKKFPGVAESTELSRKFADQGVKISVRKEGTKEGKRKRGDNSGDEDDRDD